MRLSVPEPFKPALIRFDREAWLRFFVAVGGLLLALAAAILSTVFREQGNLLGIAICASAALIIAGVVALTTVPYLAKRVALEPFRSALDYDVTREGAIYLTIAIVIGVAALNTGNNLLFIVVAAMLAAILVSGITSAAVLRRISVEFVFPQHVFAGKAVLGGIALDNLGILPSFSVSVVNPQRRKKKHWKWERSVFSLPPNRPNAQPWFHLPYLSLRYLAEDSKEKPILDEPTYFPYIPRRSTVSANIELLFNRRGHYHQEEFGLATKFPFSFLKKTRRAPLRKEIVVYPSVEPTDEFVQALPMITGEFEAFVAGQGTDLYRIREYAAGDAARHIDWKSTAKSGSLKLREFARENERKLRIVLDNPAPHVLTAEAYESAVRLTASFAWYFADGTTELRFAAPGYAGSTDIFDFLRYLALVQPTYEPSIVDKLDVSSEYNLVITARPGGTIPTGLWNCSYFIFVGGK